MSFLMPTLWQRYLLRETIKIFILFLGCFLSLYVAIDYSVHMQSFLHTHALRFSDIALYYGLQFIKRANLLVPLALLVATIRVLTSLNAQRELLALQAAGLPLRKILRPFLFLGIVATAFNFYNAEYLLPRAADYIDAFAASHLKAPSERKSARLRVVDLKDGSRLAFQKFDKKTSTFHDLFWIRSIDDIWRIKTLTIDRSQPNLPPTGTFVDRITRGPDGGLHKTASYPTLSIPGLKAGGYLEKQPVKNPSNQSFRELLHILRKETNPDSSYYNEILSVLVSKCALPLLSPLVILCMAPYCTRFKRHSSSFFLYTVGIFGFIAFFVLLNAASILGQSQVISPFAATLVPLGLAYGLFTWKFVRLS